MLLSKKWGTVSSHVWFWENLPNIYLHFHFFALSDLPEMKLKCLVLESLEDIFQFLIFSQLFIFLVFILRGNKKAYVIRFFLLANSSEKIIFTQTTFLTVFAPSTAKFISQCSYVVRLLQKFPNSTHATKKPDVLNNGLVNFSTAK